MNAKRQTIWLVSMLSLMVVLSAYYLFTEDVNKLDMTTSGQSGGQIKVDTKEQASQPDKATSAEVQSAGQKKAATDTQAATDAQAAKTDSKDAAQKSTDQQVLKQLEAQGKATSGADFFVAAQIKRNDDLAKQADKLYAIINDSKKSTDEVSKAYDELAKLEDMQEKMTGLEDELSKDYKNVVINQDSGKWTVTVETDKLQKSQAVSIVDQVMKELNVTQDKVVVQYKP